MQKVCANSMERIALPTQPTATGRGRAAIQQWMRAARLLFRDPTLGLGLLAALGFAALFVAYPLLRVIWGGFFDPRTETFSVEYFARYFDPVFGRYQWWVVWNTLVMGLGTATGGTLLGFIFAFTLTRCGMPFSRVLHFVTLLPTISPPFAVAIAAILLFGRAGLVTRALLGMRFGPDSNDIYGLDGLIFVQTITFFPIAYLIIRAMLERVDPAMEEAALNLGASRLHIFRTITLPLLIPGLAGSFLLLFVESLADLGNPLLLGGNQMVLSTEIFLAINGEYNQHKGAAFSLVLLLPTLLVFLAQRYWVSRRSYVSVTGKPASGHVTVRDPLLRWPAIVITSLALLLILALYSSILVGSVTRLWGIDYTLDFTNFATALNRGLNPILATTFLAAAATPLAALMGMVIAYLVVRKHFAGKNALDFVSNLGAAVPGTILGIGYIITFVRPPMMLVIGMSGLLVGYAVWNASLQAGQRWQLLVGSVVVATILWSIAPYFERWLWLTIIAIGCMGAALLLARQGGRWLGLLVTIPGVYLLLGLIEPLLTQPLAIYGRSLGGNLSKVVVSLANMISVFFQVPLAFVGFAVLAVAVIVLQVRHLSDRVRMVVGMALIGLALVLIFGSTPLALIGTPYIVIAAYAVRSLPASVRAGMAALQQIDPAIEEASINLGADTQTTFRRVTVPLITPALLAGMVFAFASHMTSLSAIIFLTTPRWPILTVWILSEVEQGGLSTAAAYSVILVTIVFAAILLMYVVAGRRLRALGGVNWSAGSG